MDGRAVAHPWPSAIDQPWPRVDAVARGMVARAQYSARDGLRTCAGRDRRPPRECDHRSWIPRAGGRAHRRTHDRPHPARQARADQRVSGAGRERRPRCGRATDVDAEALYDKSGAKGNRNEIDGKTILGVFDELVPDGESQRLFEPLWFRTWRFLQIDVTTSDQPLILDRVSAHFTGYPFTLRAAFDSDDPELRQIFEVSWRTARLAAHETYMDAPYWEQLQYVGDTRVDALISLAMTGDDRLPRRAMELFDQSRRAEGITQSRYPTAELQYIPPYALFFVEMVHDHWMYVGDRAFVTARLAATRAVMDWFLAHQRPDGFLDHLPFWVHGDTGTVLEEQIQDEDGGSGVVTVQFLGALRRAAELEDSVGSLARAAAYRAAADRAAAAAATLWDPGHGLMADTPARRSWSHPVNIVALLEGLVPPAEQQNVLRQVLAIARHPAGRSVSGGPGGAWPVDEIPSATYYFRFYLARALEAAGATDGYVDLLQPWRAMLADRFDDVGGASGTDAVGLPRVERASRARSSACRRRDPSRFRRLQDGPDRTCIGTADSRDGATSASTGRDCRRLSADRPGSDGRHHAPSGCDRGVSVEGHAPRARRGRPAAHGD